MGVSPENHQEYGAPIKGQDRSRERSIEGCEYPEFTERMLSFHKEIMGSH